MEMVSEAVIIFHLLLESAGTVCSAKIVVLPRS